MNKRYYYHRKRKQKHHPEVKKYQKSTEFEATKTTVTNTISSRKQRQPQTSKWLSLAAAAVLLLMFSIFSLKPKFIESDKNEKKPKVAQGAKEVKEVVKPVIKSAEAKQAVMDADLAIMSSYGLYYDYANLSLVDTVNTFLAERGIDSSQIAFTYKNLKTKEVFSMNENQPMSGGSTYKLPLNMLVVDAVKEGKVSETERYDITNTFYEYQGEHDAYVANYNGAMTIADMQYGSIVVSENTPAYALADRIGGIEKAYSQFDRYGKSKTAPFPTFQHEGNKTTTSYYIQVLDYLYKHQDKYKDLMHYLDEAFPGQWYEQYIPNVTIYQKPGYSREALNVDAIVMEETPYMLALYTSDLGGASADDIEIDAEGYNLVSMLTYVVNEWHRVNMNPARPEAESEDTEQTAIELPA